MKTQLIIGVLLMLGLSSVIAYRVRAQNAYKHAPSGGSATLEGTEAVIAAKIGGRLVELLVQQGDTVTAGQIVGRLDCDDPQAALAIAEAQVKQLQAQVALAETGVSSAKESASAATAQIAIATARTRSLDVQRKQAARDQARIQALTDTGAATTVDLDRVDTTERALTAATDEAHASIGAAAQSARAQGAGIGTAGAQVVVAKTSVEVAIAEVARAKIAVAECVLKAPRAGIVVDRLHEPGAVLAPGQSVLTMIDLRTIKA
ncbi:MAG: HlyD family secretion protein, partial [Polyangiales bacterium]